jgi:hypothetical protein
MWWTLLSPRFVLAALVAALCAGTVWYAYNNGRQSGMSQVQIKWDQEKLAVLAVLEAQNQELMKARQRERALHALMDRQRKERAREMDRIAVLHAAELERLRNRPEARAGDGGVPEGAAAGVGCTGAGLAGPDATFLAGYGADAARLQTALNECRVKYEAIQQSQ